MSTSIKILISPQTNDRNATVSRSDRTLIVTYDYSQWNGSVYHNPQGLTEIESEQDDATKQSVVTYKLNDKLDQGTIELYSDDVINGYTIQFTITVTVADESEASNSTKVS
jgi:hypothetical protein